MEFPIQFKILKDGWYIVYNEGLQVLIFGLYLNPAPNLFLLILVIISISLCITFQPTFVRIYCHANQE